MKKTINYDNGTYYTGDVNDRGVPHGQGYIRFPDGSDYVGEFKDNTLTGFGVYRY
ncbi:MAG: 2-isopropylmalate synthase, partial [Erysipelotrichaceae bacterium]|nr:2-isopropylmalate synthase [Erysipelotrichaceae bacterium]